MLAWKVRTGTWKGIRLDGLKVVASVFGTENLGAFAASPRQSILYVDERATADQKNALVEAFTSKYGSTMGAVVAIKTAPVDFAMALDGASVRVDGALALDTQKVVQVAIFFDGVMVDQNRLGGALKKLVHPDLAKDEDLAYTPLIPLTSYALGRAILYENTDTTFKNTWRDTRPRMSVFSGSFEF